VAWSARSDRRQELPPNWPALREQVKARAGGRCEKRLPSGARCPRDGVDCDHIIPGNDHRLRNLRWLCPTHHGQKSAREGWQAQRPKGEKNRPTERHPGAR